MLPVELLPVPVYCFILTGGDSATGIIVFLYGSLSHPARDLAPYLCELYKTGAMDVFSQSFWLF